MSDFVILSDIIPCHQPTTIMAETPSSSTPLFIHTVFFWLKTGISAERKKEFEKALFALRQVETVKTFHAGIPAGTARDVVDGSYDYSLVLHFDNAEDHDVYQAHPVHQYFVETQQDLWYRVQVYDTRCTIG